jgi:hypothetical protein
MAVQAASLEILEKTTLATKQDLLVLRSDLVVLRSELSEKLTEKTAELRTEIHALASSNVRQMYAAMLGQTAALLGIAYFFVAHLAR